MIWDDNQTTIKWLRNFGHHPKTKHIDTAVMSIREHVIDLKTLDVDFVKTASQVADVLTMQVAHASASPGLVGIHAWQAGSSTLLAQAH